MVKIEKKMIFSTDGKLIHRLGTDSYFTRSTALKTDTVEMFEDVEERPKFTKQEYDAEVERLIAERYTTGQEIQFAREKDAAGEKYSEYLAYVEQCKAQARENLEKRSEDIKV